jgi:hypothetical protein
MAFVADLPPHDLYQALVLPRAMALDVPDVAPIAAHPGPLRAARVRGLVRHFVALASVALLSIWILMIAAMLTTGWAGQVAGVDYRAITGAASRWVTTGNFYQPWQLAGPYAIQYGHSIDVLYPPVVLWLVVPFLFLPAFLWWAIPAAATAWGLLRLRPGPWTRMVLFVLALWPWSIGVWLWGNPSMWVLAAESLGLAYGWPAVLVLVKPTLAPFALIGVRNRSWWIALGVFILLCLPFGALWADWIRAAVVNPTNGGLGYSVPNLPYMVMPLVAWAARMKHPPACART